MNLPTPSMYDRLPPITKWAPESTIDEADRSDPSVIRLHCPGKLLFWCSALPGIGQSDRRQEQWRHSLNKQPANGALQEHGPEDCQDWHRSRTGRRAPHVPAWRVTKICINHWKLYSINVFSCPIKGTKAAVDHSLSSWHISDLQIPSGVRCVCGGNHLQISDYISFIVDVLCHNAVCICDSTNWPVSHRSFVIH